MRAVIIGGSGHIGTYLAPRLVHLGYEVINVSRGQSRPYRDTGEWKRVRSVQIERGADGFEAAVGDLKPDVLIDLICFTLESCQKLVEAVEGHVSHFLHCGTIWVHGPSVEVPTTESAPRRPFGEYGVQKAAIEAYLLQKARRDGFPTTVLHPGHIVGPGWIPVNPAGNWDPNLFQRLALGEEITLPDQGLITLHHVHADDVALAFQCALERWTAAVGESFHVVSSRAVTMRGLAAAVAGWFGREPLIRYLPWEEWKDSVPSDQARGTWDHLLHSPCCSIEKARRLLGFEPRYSSFEAVREALEWLLDHGKVSLGAGGP